MALVSFSAAEMALFNKEKGTDQIDDILVMDKKQGGTIEASISGLAPALNTVWASDVKFFVSARGASDVKCELTLADIGAQYTKILGYEETGTQGIGGVSSKTEAPYSAIIMQSTTKEGKDVFAGLLYGKWTMDTQDIKTLDEKGVDLPGDKLSGSFGARAEDGFIYVSNLDVATGEFSDVTLDDFRAYCFGKEALDAYNGSQTPDNGGQTPETGGNE